MFVLDKLKCSECGVCVAECPTHALSMIDGVPTIDFSRCDGCQQCLEVCPMGAIKAVEIPEPLSKETSEVAMISWKDVRPAIASKDTYIWKRSILPAVSTALIWAGRDVLPRMADLFLAYMERKVDERQHRRAMSDAPLPRFKTHQCQNRQVRHRYRRRDMQRRCRVKS